MRTQVSRPTLEDLYIQRMLSSAQVARRLKWSEHKVNYWLGKYGIQKRSISEAIYAKCNPDGDPFSYREPTNQYEAELKGMGLGLYWGEGTKRSKTSLKLGNTDPYLIRKFIEFLEVICGADKKKIRFGLQVFNDADPRKARLFWRKHLGVSENRFTKKTTITPSRGIGTYRHKNQNGVLMVYFHNKKLRDMICGMIENMR